jgi:hypothetical protein
MRSLKRSRNAFVMGFAEKRPPGWGLFLFLPKVESRVLLKDATVASQHSFHRKKTGCLCIRYHDESNSCVLAGFNVRRLTRKGAWMVSEYAETRATGRYLILRNTLTSGRTRWRRKPLRLTRDSETKNV